ncbi:hypothetical protein, partial [Vibrio vulnificus]|uniref:hypothetical protein n=1 Tax=Vibrio vulnificus TaxID=672 RepID=UPI0039B386A9
MMLAEHNASGWGEPRCVAGNGEEESIQQPRFDDANRLYCLTDRGGYWQPWVESARGLEPLPAAAA